MYSKLVRKQCPLGFGKSKAWNSPEVLAIHATTDKEPGNTHTRVVRVKDGKKLKADKLTHEYTVQPERVFRPDHVPCVGSKHTDMVADGCNNSAEVYLLRTK